MKWVRAALLALVLTAALTAWALAALPETLVPVGSAVGIRLEADGLVVVGFDQSGRSAAQAAGMRRGDVIQSVNGTEVSDSEAFKALVAGGGGEPLDITVDRAGSLVSLAIAPEQDGNAYRLGVYLRDAMAGIGTVTFYDPEADLYGALGHGVNDVESMVLLPLEAGEILPASVVEVRRGGNGAPGMLKGAFDTSRTLGSVEENTEHGIFGSGASSLSGRAALPVASQKEIHTGRATILCNVQSTDVQEYEVEITKLFPLETASGRNLLLTVTDPRLLRATGGIVQGMSGSPILQDGRLIGAVTHVLVNNQTCGYGIFIENMLQNCEKYK